MTAPVTSTTTGQSMLVVLVAGILLGGAGGLGFGWHYWKPETVVETAAPVVRQNDASLVLARVPDAHAKPTAIVPKGQTVARIENVTVQPSVPAIVHDTVEVPAATGPTPAHEVVKIDTVACPPVRVQLALTDLPDGTHRVIASSPDGRVTGGLDIAVKDAVVPKVLHWSAGPVYGSGGQAGAFVAREAGPLHLLVGATHDVRSGGSAFVGVGIRF